MLTSMPRHRKKSVLQNMLKMTSSEDLTAFCQSVLPCRLSIPDPDCSNLLIILCTLHFAKFFILRISFLHWSNDCGWWITLIIQLNYFSKSVYFSPPLKYDLFWWRHLWHHDVNISPQFLYYIKFYFISFRILYNMTVLCLTCTFYIDLLW